VGAGTGGGSKGARAWAERHCRGSRRRAQVRARWSTVGAGRAELTRKAHNTEREKGRVGQRLDVWQNGPARQRGKRDVRGGGATGADKLAPLGREREGEAREAETATDRWRPPIRRRGRAAWLGRLGCFDFFFSPNLLIAFQFLFSRVFNSSFKFKLI
jgi:hypothetical protein